MVARNVFSALNKKWGSRRLRKAVSDRAFAAARASTKATACSCREITTNAEVDYEAVVREAIKDIGFDAPEKGLDYKTCEVRPPAFPLARLVYHTANRAVHLNSCRS